MIKKQFTHQVSLSTIESVYQATLVWNTKKYKIIYLQLSVYAENSFYGSQSLARLYIESKIIMQRVLEIQTVQIILSGILRAS